MGQRIALERVARQWNQSDLARRAGVSVSYVNRLEAGSYKRPSAEKLSMVASALGLKIGDLTETSAGADLDILRQQLIAVYGPSRAETIDEALTVVAGLDPEDQDAAVETMLTSALGFQARAARRK